MEKINWYGAYSLAKREIYRFMRVYNQTIFTPASSALIFLAVFTLAIGSHKPEINGIPFVDFMGYGLIIMSILQNAFANSSSSFIMSKMLGYISDILMPPLGSNEIILAFCAGSVLRGVLVGIATALLLAPFVEYQLHHPLLLIFYVLASCALLGKVGILSGIISESFDHISIITSYFITPLSFLSGTFYSVHSLPAIFQTMNMLNPFFYMVDGFRYCLTGMSDGNITTGVTMLVFANIALYYILLILINKGWRLKA